MQRNGKDLAQITMVNEIAKEKTKYQPLTWWERIDRFWGIPKVSITPDEEMRRSGRMFKKNTADLMWHLKHSRPKPIPKPEDYAEEWYNQR